MSLGILEKERMLRYADIVRDDAAKRFQDLLMNSAREIGEYDQRAEALTSGYRKAAENQRGAKDGPGASKIPPLIISTQPYEGPGLPADLDPVASVDLGLDHLVFETVNLKEAPVPSFTNSVDRSQGPRLRPS